MKKRNVLFIGMTFILLVFMASCGTQNSTIEESQQKVENEDMVEDTGSVEDKSEDLQDDLSLEETISAEEKTETEPKVMTKKELYQMYLEELETLQDQYAEGNDFYSEDDEIPMGEEQGVLFAKLIDFDQDGTEELLLVYRNDTEINWDEWEISYTCEVWAKKGDESGIERIYQDVPFNDVENIMIPVMEKPDETLLVSGYGLHEPNSNHWIEYRLKNGSFSIENEIRCEYEGKDDNGDIYGIDAISINGQDVSEEEAINELTLKEEEGTYYWIAGEYNDYNVVSEALEELHETLDILTEI